MPNLSPEITVLFASVAILLTVLIAHPIIRYLRKDRVRKGFNQGHDAQEEARILLEQNGYRIIDVEPTLEGEFYIDGEASPIRIWPDYRVQKDGESFLVEVKSGEQATNPHSRATRRQLLEYAVLSPDEKILFCDMTHGELKEIEFDIDVGVCDRRPTQYRWLFFFVGVGVGAGSSLLLAKLF